MTDISVKPDRVDTLAGSVEGGARGIDDALQTLQGSKGVLLTQWRGDAAHAYAGAQEKWIQDMRALAQVGRDAAEAARSAAAAYRDADDAVGRTWGL